MFAIGKLSDAYGLQVSLFSFMTATALSGILALLLPNEAAGFRVSLRANLKVLLRLPRYGVFLLASFLIFGPMLSNNYYFGMLMKDAGGSLTGLGIAFLIAAGSEIPFMRWSEHFVVRWGLLSVLIACSAVAGVRWLLYGFEVPLAVIYATSLLQGFGIGLFIPAALRYVYLISPEGVRATAVSLYSMAGNGLGNWICTLVGGALLNRYTIHAAYVSFAVSTALGIVLLLLLVRMERR
ncbi:MFS transporter [Gordoniibacillus kamchatkensis]|uniref:MFS transporter n=1 Tax=Gordoniibacillus kamchatkensis TaxID=1590651 RepID=UPI0009E3C800|nr:MFS transporter [Paenibacillus sp. VKM B-2647]